MGVINVKKADKIMRKKEVEFVASIPPETISVLYQAIIAERTGEHVGRAHVVSDEQSDKAQRQPPADIEGFKDNPGF
ncbi:hypothetical protein GN244_ATG11556 [Phytophthora infestans]|uniref:Uncharacterized protein n=2 Tax=Phytophthora infestans TaxID=4787 RepID=A0A833T9F2_PHYIN|nr:hypothetical protein GN244_ATG11556 [Phytophthora infestans]